MCVFGLKWKGISFCCESECFYSSPVSLREKSTFSLMRIPGIVKETFVKRRPLHEKIFFPASHSRFRQRRRLCLNFWGNSFFPSSYALFS